MELLEAVNSIITKLGENPVDSVDVRHPTVSIILQHLKSVNKELQAPGWWFNEHIMKLQPNSDGYVVVPKDTISARVKDKQTYLEGRKIVCASTLNDKWDVPLWVKLRRTLEFEATPYEFASWVVDTAAVRAYVADYGYEEVVKLWQMEARAKEQLVHGEHIRQRRLSAMKAPRYQRMLMEMNT